MMSFRRATSIVCNDRRVRVATLAFTVPFVTIILCERFTSILASLICIICYAATTSLMCGSRFYQFSSQAFLLGVVSGYSSAVLMYANISPSMTSFVRYLFIFAMFHFTEMFFTGITNNENLKVDSFLLNHSFEYWIAAIVSWLEFSIERVVMPWLHSSYISLLGLCLCLVGEFIRKTAMWQASSAFTHLIAIRKNKNHSLVTDGIYGYVRHPGYLGWFLWSIGTQTMLCNPFCFVVYAYVTFRFFEDRIYEEERYLVEFFGRRYMNYQQEVPSGIPFIKGYRLPQMHNE